MSISGSSLAPLVYADYLSAIPTAIDANRSNAAKGVGVHNVPLEMVTAISNGFCTALLGSSVFDNYVGVVGGTASAALVPPVFNPGIVSSATATFLSSMGWTGASAASFADILIFSFFQQVTTLAQISMNPIPGAGPGTGVISSVSNPSLGTTFTNVCSNAIMAEVIASGYFNVDDVAGGPPTPEIALLMTNLSTAYGTIVGGVTATIPYTGISATPTTALTVVNTGKFL